MSVGPRGGRRGVEPAAFEELLGRGAPAVTEDDLRAAVDEMVSEHGLTSQQASFDHRDVVRAWCESLPAGTKVTLEALEDLADVVESDERVIQVVDGRALLSERQRVERPDGHVTGPGLRERRWSTTDMLEVERRLLADAGPAGAGCGSGAIPAVVVERALASRRDLAGEQAAMVRRLTTSGDAVEVVVGRAGSGKTYALAAAAEIWRDAGYRPMGLGLAARAAHELESTAGIPSTTVARFLIDLDQAPGILNERHVLIVDEAGMVDTRRLGRLVRHAQLAGAKVVLVGDHHQLPPVEAGGAFGALVTRARTVCANWPATGANASCGNGTRWSGCAAAHLDERASRTSWPSTAGTAACTWVTPRRRSGWPWCTTGTRPGARAPAWPCSLYGAATSTS